MGYHSKGIGKNKAIKKERNKPLPIGLMTNDFKGLRIIRRRDIEDKINSKDIQNSEDVD